MKCKSLVEVLHPGVLEKFLDTGIGLRDDLLRVQSVVGLDLKLGEDFEMVRNACNDFKTFDLNSQAFYP